MKMAASALLALLLAGGYGGKPAQSGRPALYGYRVVHVYPHDPQAFTQGLLFRDGFLYESVGQYGRSALRKVELTTGKVVQQAPVAATYFAEGLTDWKGSLIQLTWRHGLGFVYDWTTFRMQRQFQYTGEGWGLTHDATRLILSDGVTPRLRFFSPSTFDELGSLTVRDEGSPVMNLNELEFVRGEVYANVWHTNRIAIISPVSGAVSGWADLSGLLASGEMSSPEAVLNGIAYDSTANRLFVTGKLWPKLFEIRLERK